MRHGSRVPGQKPWWEPYLHGTAILLCSPYTLMCMTYKLAYKSLDHALTKRRDKMANTARPLSRKRQALPTMTANRTPLGDSNGSIGLFNRLPRELRDLIYAEVLGTMLLAFGGIRRRRNMRTPIARIRLSSLGTRF